MNESRLLRRMILGRALNSVQESGSAMINVNLKDELPCSVTDIMREVNSIEQYIANYEKYKPYLPIIEEYIQKHEAIKQEKAQGKEH